MSAISFRKNFVFAWAAALLVCGCSPHAGTFASRNPGAATPPESGLTPGRLNPIKIDAQSTPSWQNFAIPAMSGAFNLEFDAIPNGGGINGLTSLSSGAASSSSQGAVVLRFNGSGTIDALNGGSFSSVTSLPYSAGVSYHFRIAVNVPARTYTAIVAPEGGLDQVIATNYAFGSSVSSLNDLGVMASAGSHDIFNVELSIPVSTAPAPSPGNGAQSIQSKVSGLCLAVSGAQNNGAAVVQANCSSGDPSQSWSLVSAGNNQYEIHASGGRCLDVTGQSTVNGTLMQLWDCWGNNNQYWNVVDQGNGTVNLVGVKSGSCLDVPGGTKTSGAQIQIWACGSGNVNQQWMLSAGAPSPAPAPAPAPAPGGASADGTTVPPASRLVDGSGNVWTFGALVDPAYGSVIVMNGAPQNGTAATLLLYYKGTAKL